MSKLDELFALFKRYCAEEHDHTTLALEDDESSSLFWWENPNPLVEFDSFDDGVAWLKEVLNAKSDQ